MNSVLDVRRVTLPLERKRIDDLLNVRPVSEIFRGNRVHMPDCPGVYAFWWTAGKSRLLESDRRIEIGGPNRRYEMVEYKEWWLPDILPCLYVGKSTNLKKRLPLHIKRKTKKRLHPVRSNHRKQTPCTTSCQLRFGIEHIFRNELDPLSVIFSSVGLSYSIFPSNSLAERFFVEDWLVGNWRPWFNIDSER